MLRIFLQNYAKARLLITAKSEMFYISCFIANMGRNMQKFRNNSIIQALEGLYTRCTFCQIFLEILLGITARNALLFVSSCSIHVRLEDMLITYQKLSVFFSTLLLPCDSPIARLWEPDIFYLCTPRFQVLCIHQMK